MTARIPFSVFGQHKFEKEMKTMVRLQIQGRGISDKNTLKAMQTVPRHLFVIEKYRDDAYEDRPLHYVK